MPDIFDMIASGETIEAPEGRESQFVEREEVVEEQPWYKSVPLDMLKGLMEGVTRLGRMMGPLQPYTADDVFSMEKFTEQLDELMPTDSNVIGRGARRTLNIAPSAMANPFVGPELAAAQSLGGGILGQAVEEAGGGELMQTGAEILPFFFNPTSGGPTLAQKGSGISQAVSKARMLPERIRKIASKASANTEELNELLNFAQKSGMTAEEIAPLMQGDTKKWILSKLASKGKGIQQRLSRSKEAIGEIADRFKTGPHGETVLAQPESNKMISQLQDILYDMPAKTRNVIMEDFQQLANSPRDTKSIIKFYRDIGAQYGSNKKQLGRLKEPLKEALATIDPQLANDFNLTNKLFEKYYDISSKLKPGIADQMLSAATPMKMTYGLATGNYPLIAEAVTEQAARRLAAEMLTNPRLQNISKKMVNALNKGQFVIADRIREEYIRALKDDYPDISAELQKESLKDFLGE